MPVYADSNNCSLIVLASAEEAAVNIYSAGHRQSLPSQIVGVIIAGQAGYLEWRMRASNDPCQKGCSPDNSACEGLFGRLKNEMFYNRNWAGVSIHQFIEILNNYLIWYNETRIKTSLGNMSPLEYRRSLGLVA